MFDFSDTKVDAPMIRDSSWGKSIQLQWDEKQFISGVAHPKGMNNENFFTLLLHMFRSICLDAEDEPSKLAFELTCNQITRASLDSIFLLNMRLAMALSTWFSAHGKLQPEILPQFLNFIFNPPSLQHGAQMRFGPKTLDCAHQDLLTFLEILLQERKQSKDSKGVKAVSQYISNIKEIPSPQSQEGVTLSVVHVRNALKVYAMHCIIKPAAPVAQCLRRLAAKQEALL